MDVIKFVYNSTTHGNYIISQVEMEPILNPSTNEVDFKLKGKSFFYSTPRYRLSMKSRYTKNECFDTKAEAIAYANKEIIKYREAMLAKLQKEADQIQTKIDKIALSSAKMRYFNFVKEQE